MHFYGAGVGVVLAVADLLDLGVAEHDVAKAAMGAGRYARCHGVEHRVEVEAVAARRVCVFSYGPVSNRHTVTSGGFRGFRAIFIRHSGRCM